MFTFPAGLVLDQDTRDPVANVTATATSTIDSSVLVTYSTDELVRAVSTDEDGYYSEFKSTESRIRLSFGGVPLTLLSLEAIDSSAEAAGARVAAENAAARGAEAVIAAVEAKDAAQAARNAAQAPTEQAVATALATEGSPARDEVVLLIQETAPVDSEPETVLVEGDGIAVDDVGGATRVSVQTRLSVAALDTTYALQGVDATQRLMAALAARTRDASVLVVSDSTGAGPGSWVPMWADALAAGWPGWTVTTRLWDDVAGVYAAPVTVQTGAGTGVRTLTVFVAAVSGFTTQHWLGARAVAAFRGIAPDLTMVSLGHNEQSIAGLWHSRMVTLTETLATVHPGADILLVAQNPATGNTFQQERAEVYREIAARRGYGFVDVGRAFADTGDAAGLTVDGVHPTTTGHQLWADTVAGAFVYQGGRRTAQPPSTLDMVGDNLLLNPDFQTLVAGVPEHWNLARVTSERDTVNYESADIYRLSGGGSHTSRATKFTGTGESPSAEIGQFIPVRRHLGKWLTLAARMFVPAGQASANPGRIGITAGTATTNLAPAAGTTGAWQWVAVSHLVPANAATIRAFMFVDLASAPVGTVTLERMVLVPGKYPFGK